MITAPFQRPASEPDLRRELDAEAEALVARLSERARNLYLTRQLLCTESVLVALNQGLNGGLSESQAVAVAAPFCVAMGDSGCICGALSGAEMACGLFLGKEKPYRHRKEIRDIARRLHDAFKAANGATCCRILTRKVRHEKHAHFQQCADLTGDATALAARLILQQRPELAAQADGQTLDRRQSRIGGAIRYLYRRLFS